MCCSLINKDFAETVCSPFNYASFALSKTQTFVPILGVIPAIATVVVGLIASITALVLKFFANEEAQKELNETLHTSLFLMGYSIVNIASGGLFTPICEYVTEFLSTDPDEGKKIATAGFFDIFPNLRQGNSITFFYESSTENGAEKA